jgi:hypothetical protein
METKEQIIDNLFADAIIDEVSVTKENIDQYQGVSWDADNDRIYGELATALEGAEVIRKTDPEPIIKLFRDKFPKKDLTVLENEIKRDCLYTDMELQVGKTGYYTEIIKMWNMGVVPFGMRKDKYRIGII